MYYLDPNKVFLKEEWNDPPYFKTVVDSLKLIDYDFGEKGSLQNRNFAYMGYTPVMPRLLDYLVQGGWTKTRKLDDLRIPY